MGVKWTKEQLQVIEERNKNLLVSAAAGSGKTAVLVERIITMITDEQKPMDIDQLLIVTFTNAAAAEMRERIREAIEVRLDENPYSSHLQRQSTLVHYARITTIHSFCLYVIRNYFTHLDIDPGFRIGDEGELKLLKGDILEEVLDSYYEAGREDFGRFIEGYSSGKMDGGITDLILRLYQFSQSYPWPEEWLDSCLSGVTWETYEELLEAPFMKELLRDVHLQAEELLRQWQTGMSICLDADGPYMYEKAFESDKAVLLLLQEAGSYQEIWQALKYLSFDRLSSKKDVAVSDEKRSQAQGIRNHIKDVLKKMKDFYYVENPEEMLLSLQKGRESIQVLVDLTRDFTATYQAKKRDRNILDFNDFEHLALQVLVEKDEAGWRPSAAAKELAHQYKEILIDEYQDSNFVQETLLRSISREWDGKPNTFMVGDVKQSIYRFRLARPELFMEKYDNYTKDASLYQKIELHKNFRSREMVLSGINFIFYQIMKKSLGNIDYNDETALYPGASFPEPEDLLVGTKTELLIAELEEKLSESHSADALNDVEYTTRELEGKLIAKRIRELTDKESGLHVFDKKTGQYRLCEYRDIVILLRSFTGWSEVFLNVLMNEGIPAYAQSQTGYFTAVEVQTMLAMLKVIDNPMEDIPLAAVLKSPIGGFTADDLAKILAVYKKSLVRKSVSRLYDACEYYQELPAGEQQIQKRLAAFFEMVAGFRYDMTYLNLHDLLFKVLKVTGYYAYAAAMPAGDVRRGNLNMLVEKAIQYEKTSYHGLFHFIRYIEKLQKYQTDYGEASLIGEDDNTVRIFSIHKSKGLEFPVVFLAGMSKSFNKQDGYSKILLHPDLGIASDYVDVENRTKTPTLMKKVFRRKLELENLGEELRVLYVAMTRAKEKLIMTATVKNLEDQFDKFQGIEGATIPLTRLQSAGSYLDWVLMALSRPEQFPKQNSLFDISVQGINDLMYEEVAVQARDEMAKEVLLQIDSAQVFDEDFKAELKKRLEFCYPFEAAITTHTKMSVSELKQYGQMADDDESLAPYVQQEDIEIVPVFLEEGEPLKGAKRGTAYHRVLELMNFADITDEQSIKAQLEALLEGERISELVYEAIYLPVLYRFFTSPLGLKMIQADREGRLHKERQFVMGVTEEVSGEMVLIQGIIDSFIEEEDGLILVDYKTDYLLEGGEAELIKRYRVQMDYYSLALAQITGATVKEKVIFSTSLSKEIVVI